MRRLILVLSILVIVLLPAIAQAHGGHGVVAQSQTLMAGPYPLMVEFDRWPVKAGMNVMVVVVPEGGIMGKSGGVKMVPAPSVSLRTTSQKLTSHAGVLNAWTVQIDGMPGGPGPWTWVFQIEGPQGTGVGSLAWNVEPPPGFPLWLGWVLGLFPLYGLGWFMLREWRRFRRELATESRARLHAVW